MYRFSLYRSKLLLLPALLLVSSCGLGSGDVKEKLGLRRDSPDEFRVISAPPLSLPPDFNLRPPLPAGKATVQSAASVSAKGTLLGDNGVAAPVSAVATSALLSGAEARFMDKVGTTSIDPNIRNAITSDNEVHVPQEKKGFFKRWFSKDDDPTVTVDAAAEKQRIDANKQANQPVTQGDTPVVKENSGLMDKLFHSSDDE